MNTRDQSIGRKVGSNTVNIQQYSLLSKIFKGSVWPDVTRKYN